MAQQKTPSKKPVKKPVETTQGTEGGEGEGDENEEETEGDDPEAENRRINAIVTSRVKREMKGVMSQLETLKGLVEKLAPAKREDEEETEGEETEGETTKKPVESQDPKVTRQLTRLQKQLDEEKRARKEAEQAREQEAERTKKQEMRNIFSTILTEYGCTDPRLNKAAVNILEEEGVMIRNEEGKIRFKGVDKYGIETDFDPKVGLKAWIAGDGKSFVPAVDAGGSGTGGSTQGLGNSKFTAKELKNLSPQQIAAINLERACSGLGPLPGTEPEQG